MDEVRGSVSPEMVDLVNRSDLDLICKVKVVVTEDLDSGTHQGSIALLVNFLQFNLHPFTIIYQVTEYID